MVERGIWVAAFAQHMQRGDDAEKAAYWANAAVREYRCGPLGGAGRCENELCPEYRGGQVEQAVRRPVPGTLQGAAIGAVAKQVAEFHEKAAAAKQPQFKFGDRVLVTPVNGPPFYATAGGCDESWVHCYTSFVGRCDKFPIDWVKHAPEVSHD